MVLVATTLVVVVFLVLFLGLSTGGRKGEGEEAVELMMFESLEEEKKRGSEGKRELRGSWGVKEDPFAFGCVLGVVRFVARMRGRSS